MSLRQNYKEDKHKLQTNRVNLIKNDSGDEKRNNIMPENMPDISAIAGYISETSHATYMYESGFLRRRICKNSSNWEREIKTPQNTI